MSTENKKIAVLVDVSKSMSSYKDAVKAIYDSFKNEIDFYYYSKTNEENYEFIIIDKIDMDFDKIDVDSKMIEKFKKHVKNKYNNNICTLIDDDIDKLIDDDNKSKSVNFVLNRENIFVLKKENQSNNLDKIKAQIEEILSKIYPQQATATLSKHTSKWLWLVGGIVVLVLVGYFFVSNNTKIQNNGDGTIAQNSGKGTIVQNSGDGSQTVIITEKINIEKINVNIENEWKSSESFKYTDVKIDQPKIRKIDGDTFGLKLTWDILPKDSAAAAAWNYSFTDYDLGGYDPMLNKAINGAVNHYRNSLQEYLSRFSVVNKMHIAFIGEADAVPFKRKITYSGIDINAMYNIVSRNKAVDEQFSVENLEMENKENWSVSLRSGQQFSGNDTLALLRAVYIKNLTLRGLTVAYKDLNNKVEDIIYVIINDNSDKKGGEFRAVHILFEVEGVMKNMETK